MCRSTLLFAAAPDLQSSLPTEDVSATVYRETFAGQMGECFVG